MKEMKESDKKPGLSLHFSGFGFGASWYSVSELCAVGVRAALGTHDNKAEIQALWKNLLEEPKQNICRDGRRIVGHREIKVFF